MDNTMHNWFEAKIRYEKVCDNGMTRKVTEPYLVDALSFTEAESRIIEELVPFISGEFTVSGIKRANYSEIFESDDPEDDRWFKCKIYFITIDEKSGAEKKFATQMLVQAADLRVAVKNLDEHMKGIMADYAIAAVSETAIMDVYPYVSKGNGEFESGAHTGVQTASAQAGAASAQAGAASAQAGAAGFSCVLSEAARGTSKLEGNISALINECPDGKTMTVNVGGKVITIDRSEPGNTVVRPMGSAGDEGHAE